VTAPEQRPSPAHGVLALVLQIGFVAGGCLFATGAILRVVAGGSAAPAFRLTGLLESAPIHRQVEMLGVVVLAITPAAGVATLLISYIKARDWAATAVAFAVLAILAAAVVFGRG
jgi:uncharacterized membrane protein